MVDTRFAVSVHILTALAYFKGERMTSIGLAKSVQTSPVVVRRLVAKLVEHGLVESFRGKTGGLQLARPAEKINLRDVYLAALEKPLLAANQKPVHKPCPVSCSMQRILAGVLQGVEHASLAHLQKLKLSDLTKKVNKPHV